MITFLEPLPIKGRPVGPVIWAEVGLCVQPGRSLDPGFLGCRLMGPLRCGAAVEIRQGSQVGRPRVQRYLCVYVKAVSSVVLFQ